MLRSRKEKQQGMEVVILEQMVPEKHLLRRIDRSIDFSFINRLCAPLYSKNTGRTACSACCLWAICMGSIQSGGWKKKSTAASLTGGSVGWV